jgi:hypothetical protein
MMNAHMIEPRCLIGGGIAELYFRTPSWRAENGFVGGCAFNNPADALELGI